MFYYRVSSADEHDNLATVPLFNDPANEFHTLSPSFSDTTVNDFTSGMISSCNYVSNMANGELILAPTIGAEFSGTSLPDGWFSSPWNPGGSATVNDGVITVNGALVGSNTFYGPGHSLEFVATFSAQSSTQNEHIGFGIALDSQPWAIFSTGYPGGTTLKARTNDVEVDLGASYLGSPHRFRITWTTTTVTYFIDDLLVASHTVTISQNMRPPHQ